MQKFLAVGKIFNMLRLHKGQGLIEVTITILIIASVALALSQYQIYLAYSNSVSQQQNTAMIIAMQQIETIRDFSAISSYNTIASTSSIKAAENTTYTITTTITTNTNPNYKKIDVTVSWTDRRNISQSIRLTSTIAGIDPAYSSSIMG